MSLQVTTPQAAIEQYVQDKVAEFTEHLTRQLCYIGEAALKAAREKGSFKDYTDRSGNLRNSTGYVVAIGGKIAATAGFDKSEGLPFAKELATTTDADGVLVVCAGMNYATYVSARGYDVLDSAELEAQRMANELIK